MCLKWAVGIYNRLLMDLLQSLCQCQTGKNTFRQQNYICALDREINKTKNVSIDAILFIYVFMYTSRLGGHDQKILFDLLYKNAFVVLASLRYAARPQRLSSTKHLSIYKTLSNDENALKTASINETDSTYNRMADYVEMIQQFSPSTDNAIINHYKT